jgi:hypothetical protein
MKVLVACEESQIVTKAFRLAGHEAYSCDLEAPSGGHPEWHFQGDVLEYLKWSYWDLVIAHPPYTFLTVANTYLNRGCSKYTIQEAREHQAKAQAFFMEFVSAPAERIAIENPIGVMNTRYRKPDQIIQPYEYGHPESKKTCLWLKNLPKLVPTGEIAEVKRYRCTKCGSVFDAQLGVYGCCKSPAKPIWENQTPSGQNKLRPSPDRAKIRSKTYEGVANAMAMQWSIY